MTIVARGCLAAALLMPTWVAAQSAESGKAAAKEAVKPSVAVAVSATPERTTASFGDWILRCETASVAPSSRTCEVALAVTLQGQQNPMAQVAIGRQAVNEPKCLTVVLPPNISFAAKPNVSTTKAGALPLELTWQRCAPGGCFASAPVSEELVGTLSSVSEPGKLQFRDAAERDVALPLSFRGLSQALAALGKEQ